MARRRPEACMFCDSVPCKCNGQKKTVKKPKTQPAVARPAPTFQHQERDLTMEAALRAVEPLMNKADRLYYQHILHPKPSDDLQRRIDEWRRAYL